MAEKKTVLITGCSQGGLGDALAREFHRQGLLHPYKAGTRSLSSELTKMDHLGQRVFASARNPAKIAHLEALGIETILMDVTSEESVQKAAAEISSLTNNRLDILINNAGLGSAMPFTDISISEVRRIYETNVFSIFTVTKAFAPLVINAKGIIANQSSQAGHLGPPLQAVYNSSKGAVQLLTATMRLDFAPLGVQVTELVTGAVKTNIVANLDKPAIPQNSYYAPIKERVEYMMNGGIMEGRMIDADAYAKGTVADLTRKKVKPEIWRGGGAGLMWFLANMVPAGWLDWELIKLMGLDTLYGKVKSV